MTAYSKDGAVIVCTSTREERLEQDDAPAIHFVQHEQTAWSWE